LLPRWVTQCVKETLASAKGLCNICKGPSFGFGFGFGHFMSLSVESCQRMISEKTQSTCKNTTDFKNQWLFNLVGPPGLEPGTKGL
jgi:hypothetical protein